MVASLGTESKSYIVVCGPVTEVQDTGTRRRLRQGRESQRLPGGGEEGEVLPGRWHEELVWGPLC